MSSLLGHPLITLRYPPSWIRDVNPSHEATRQDTLLWLRDLSVADSSAARRALAAMNVGWYGGAPFPEARPEELATIMRFFTLWILHDEVLEGLGADAPRVLGDAVVGMPARCPDESPFVRGWWQLGRRFRATMSPRWLSRFSARFVDWLASLEGEARLARAATPAALSTYLDVRDVNIGLLPTACWIEYAAGRELDAHVLADPDVALVERLAARAVVFQNDIAGFDKDAARGWPNAVLSLAAEKGISIAAAFAAAEVLHEETVAALDAAGARLLHRHGDAVRFWVMGLYRLVAGLAQWHVRTPRYTATLPGGQRLQVRVAPRAPSRPAHFAPPRHDEGR